MWKGKLNKAYLDTGQEGYATAPVLVYPKGVKVIDCALGTNPLGDSPAVAHFFESSPKISVSPYPMPEPEGLKKSIAEGFPSWNIDKDHVLVGGGSMGVLVTLFRLLAGPESSFTGISPQFTDGVLQGLYTGSAYEPLRLKGPRFALEERDPAELLEEEPSLVYLDRPHNPTGQALPLERVDQLARHAMKKGVWVIIDEAYGDFLPDDQSAAVISLPNVVVCRSFSKGRGGAGLRVGFAVSRSPDLSKAFRTLQPPFAVGVIDSMAAQVLLEDQNFIRETRTYVRKAKERVVEALDKKDGLSVAETDLRVPICLVTADEGDLAVRLAAAGISCEGGRGFFDLDERSVRLRVPAPSQLEEFLRRIAAL